MFKYLVFLFVISVFVVNYNYGSNAVAFFTFVYFLFAVLIYVLKYIFVPNKNVVYTSYIRDIWRRVFNRFYVFLIFFLPVLIAYNGDYNTLQSKLDAYSLCMMFMFYAGVILFFIRVVIKTILLVFNRFIYEIDPNIVRIKRRKP